MSLLLPVHYFTINNLYRSVDDILIGKEKINIVDCMLQQEDKVNSKSPQNNGGVSKKQSPENTDSLFKKNNKNPVSADPVSNKKKITPDKSKKTSPINEKGLKDCEVRLVRTPVKNEGGIIVPVTNGDEKDVGKESQTMRNLKDFFTLPQKPAAKTRGGEDEIKTDIG